MLTAPFVREFATVTVGTLHNGSEHLTLRVYKNKCRSRPAEISFARRIDRYNATKWLLADPRVVTLARGLLAGTVPVEVFFDALCESEYPGISDSVREKFLAWFHKRAAFLLRHQ